jgi:hypothetical protein
LGKNIWLNEQQIGDLIWKDDGHFFGEDRDNVFREFNIGNLRVDFAKFNRDGFYGIDLYELKITANVDSLLQILKYKRHLDEYIRCEFFSIESRGESFKRCPRVRMHLIARYFDSQIIEACLEADIALWKVDVISKNEINIEETEFDIFPNVPNSFILSNKLKTFFGENHV